MSPVADESARRFKYVALVFNPHIIFQNLRNKGLFESFRNIIRRNVEKYHGGSNPKIGDYGMTFEAPQYALTKESFFIGNCPFTGKKGIALHYKRKRCPLY